MSVTTVDLDEGPNADIEYAITSSDSDKFDIGRLDGILRTKAVLDREDQAVYSVTVTATDQGKPSLSASMEVIFYYIILTKFLENCSIVKIPKCVVFDLLIIVYLCIGIFAMRFQSEGLSRNICLSDQLSV